MRSRVQRNAPAKNVAPRHAKPRRRCCRHRFQCSPLAGNVGDDEEKASPLATTHSAATGRQRREDSDATIRSPRRPVSPWVSPSASRLSKRRLQRFSVGRCVPVHMKSPWTALRLYNRGQRLRDRITRMRIHRWPTSNISLPHTVEKRMQNKRKEKERV